MDPFLKTLFVIALAVILAGAACLAWALCDCERHTSEREREEKDL